jgi:hypothetical protein
MSVFNEWTCAFPGKMGLSWKRAWDGVGTKEEAEIQSAKNCDVIAIPLQLFEKMKEHERRMVLAENKLDRLKVAAMTASKRARAIVGDMPWITENLTQARIEDLIDQIETGINAAVSAYAEEPQ